ncbi:hypothetical protein BDV12DRAFT_194124 [Aspergillus spectabilis]
MACPGSDNKNPTLPSDSDRKGVNTACIDDQDQKGLAAAFFDNESRSQAINFSKGGRDKHEETRRIGDAPSRLEDDEEILSYRSHHSRKRSQSLPTSTVSASANTEETQYARSEAVSLLRARTLSRLFESDQPSLESVLTFLKTNPPPSEKQLDGMAARDKASIMDFVTIKKPRKKNKAKKKKEKGVESSVEDNVSAEEWFSESSRTETNTAAFPFQSNRDSFAIRRPGSSDYVILRADDRLAHEKATGATNDNSKGKQRLAESGTASESTKDVAHPTAEPSLARKRLDYARAVIEAPITPVFIVVKEPRPSTPSPSKQGSLRSTGSKKETRPSIEENKSQQESVSASPALYASTPKSSGTVSTSYTWTTHQTTTASDTPLSDSNKSRNNATNQATTSQVISTHAHVHAHAHSTTNRDIQHRRGQTITSQKPPGFFYQLDSHGFPCARPDCDKRCNLWDGSTVICPRCGPYSETRYCTLQHLLDDIRFHWLICGQNVFQHPCRESSIPKSVRENSPLIPCLHSYDTPERHRQAVYFNMNAAEGDYFIFSDWMDMVEAGFPEDNTRLRCSSRVVHVVRFDDTQEKDRFRRVLAACLFVTIECPSLTDYLFRLLRDSLRTTLTPTPTPTPSSNISTLLTTLEYQLLHEFATTIQPTITGDRHACTTDWTGQNRRNCADAVCRSEYRRLLGSLGGGGHRALIEHLESSYWILRAARVSHPDVGSVAERMRGVGFRGVAEEERRAFWRGAGWEGAQEGEDGVGEMEMEIEGVNA